MTRRGFLTLSAGATVGLLLPEMSLPQPRYNCDPVHSIWLTQLTAWSEEIAGAVLLTRQGMDVLHYPVPARESIAVFFRPDALICCDGLTNASDGPISLNLTVVWRGNSYNVNDRGIAPLRPGVPMLRLELHA